MKILITAFILAIQLGSAYADEGANLQVIALLKAQFDKPDKPLKVDAVTSFLDYGLAAWTQGEMGGRALLKKTGDGWKITLCGGKELMSAAVLEKSGLPSDVAKKLVKEMAESEAKLSSGMRRQFDSFEMNHSVKEEHHQSH